MHGAHRHISVVWILLVFCAFCWVSNSPHQNRRHGSGRYDALTALAFALPPLSVLSWVLLLLLVASEWQVFFWVVDVAFRFLLRLFRGVSLLLAPFLLLLVFCHLSMTGLLVADVDLRLYFFLARLVACVVILSCCLFAPCQSWE